MASLGRHKRNNTRKRSAKSCHHQHHQQQQQDQTDTMLHRDQQESVKQDYEQQQQEDHHTQVDSMHHRDHHESVKQCHQVQIEYQHRSTDVMHHRDQQQEQYQENGRCQCQYHPTVPCPVTAFCSVAPTTSCHPWKHQMSLPPILLPSLAFYCLLLVGSLVTPCAAICPNNCTCDDDALVVRCEPSKIDILPLTFNPALQQLTMYGTQIHALDVNSLHWYLDLRHVNLSKNMIKYVNPDTFKNQMHLEELHLAQNTISDLTADMFVGLFNLIVLSLRGNMIKSLDGGVFIHLKHLRDLDLSENRIEKLEDQALAGLSNLRVLHLRDNRLSTIPSSNLALVPDLAELSLGSNDFTEVVEGDLQSMKTLKSLDLSGAMLAEGLSNVSFIGLSGLRKLKLESCGLKSVPTSALSPLNKLEELHIGRNLFTILPSDAFRSNRNLHSLFVSGCPNLLYLDKGVLQHNLNIKQVVITQNPQLTYIAPAALRFLPELSLLDLHDNNLKQVSEHAASWTDIETWHLEGNPLTCNCSAAWLHILTLAPNASASLKCASPPHLAGIPLHSTQMSDLACGMDPATQGLVIGLVVCAIVVVVAAVVVVMLYRHHGSCVHRLLKGHHIGGRGSGCDRHPYTHNYSQAYIMTPNKPVPVTEL